MKKKCNIYPQITDSKCFLWVYFLLVYRLEIKAVFKLFSKISLFLPFPKDTLNLLLSKGIYNFVGGALHQIIIENTFIKARYAHYIPGNVVGQLSRILSKCYGKRGYVLKVFASVYKSYCTLMNFLFWESFACGYVQ